VNFTKKILSQNWYKPTSSFTTKSNNMQYTKRNSVFKIKNMRIKYQLILFVFFIFILIHGELKSCTTLIAGKNTTVDGSVLFARSEDDQEQLDYYWYIPRKNHEPNSIIFETGGLDIPQAEKTYAYFWDQSPKMMFSNVIINEWGVAFGSNGCGSKENAVNELEKRGDIVKGGIGFRLRFILAERCKTARGAVLLASELINKYGYNGSGRSLNIVDPNEAWQLQMACGKHFVARRVQDDEVVLTANTFSIREVDMNDSINFICSPDLIDYAIKRGWYNPEKDDKFDFAKAYAPDDFHKADWNTHRLWMLAKLLQKGFPLSIEDVEKGNMPVSVKPDNKLSVQDMINIYRNHYENTDLCKYLDGKISPHYIDNNPICNDGTHKVNIIQQRSWLPVEIGTVNWRALSHPCQSVFIPWYLGINNIPKTYQMAYEDPNKTDKNLPMYHFMGPDWQIWDMDLNSASCVFRMLNNIGDSKYSNNHKTIREIFDKIELEQLKRQPEIEKEALRIYKKNKNETIKYLTQYTEKQAMTAFDKAKELIINLLKE
jgi:dipeptidase